MARKRVKTAALGTTCLLLLLAVGSLVLGARAAAGAVVDRMVAVLDKNVVTKSDMVATREIAKKSGLSITSPERLFQGDEAQIERNVFKEVVLTILAYSQAAKLNMGDIDPSVVDQDYKKLRASIPSDEEFKRFTYDLGLAEDQLRFHFKRLEICKKYLDKKIGLLVKIGLPSYYADNKDRYGGKPFEQVKDQAAADMYAEKMDAWLFETLARSDLVILEDLLKDFSK